MNKVITIRLGHYVLTIDEDAAAKLGSYTDAVHRKYAGDNSSAEIVSDIEDRIGELLDKKQRENSRNFTTIQDVNEVIEQMGPVDGNPSSEAGSTEFQRRLFRDSDNKIVGGVCGGIGAYFDIDPVILRVILVIFVFIFGFGIPLYIVLWVVMPEAKTTAEKLMMRGQKPTLQNIEDNIKTEFQDVKKRFRYSQNQGRFGSFLSTLFIYFGKAIGWVFRVVFIFVAITLIIALVTLLIHVFTNSLYFNEGNIVINGQQGLNTLLNTAGDPTWIKIGLITLIFLMISVIGLNAVTNRAYRERTKLPRRYLAWGTTILFVVLFVFSFQGIRSVSHHTERITYNDIISVSGDTLLLDATVINTDAEGFYTLNTFNEILTSEDEHFHIEQRNTAFGHNRISSSVHIENAPRDFKIQGNTLTLNQGSMVRSLEGNGLAWVRYTLYVPKGKSVKTTSNFHFLENNYTELYAKNSCITMDSTGNIMQSGKFGVQVALDEHVKRVSVHGRITVQLVHSNVNRVELISGPIVSHRNWIHTSANGVEISDERQLHWDRPSHIRIYLKNLETVSASGAAKVQFKKWDLLNLDLDCEGASEIDGVLSADHLEVEADGASKISLTGTCDHLDLDVSGASTFSGEFLEAKRVKVQCNGASDVTIWALDEIQGDAGGASTLHLKGHPRESNVETSGASTFRRI